MILQEKKIPPFLIVNEDSFRAETVPDWCNYHTTREELMEKERNVGDNSTLGYALITGASLGIGRAISIELARYGFPLILTSRNELNLEKLAIRIRQCYDVDVRVISSDLSIPGEVEKLYNTIMLDVDDTMAKIDVLILNAGIGLTSDITSLSTSEIQKAIQLNSGSIVEMSSMFGADMKQRRRGRIVIVSSVVSKVLSIPGASIYSATKAFNRNIAYGLMKEMEEFGVGVTCLSPGATSTDFASASEEDSRTMSSDAMVWYYPFVVSTPEYVAKQTVKGMLYGSAEVIPGILNYITFYMLYSFLPMRIDLWFMKFSWHPWPYGKKWLFWKRSVTKSLDDVLEKDL